MRFREEGIFSCVWVKCSVKYLLSPLGFITLVSSNIVAFSFCLDGLLARVGHLFCKLSQ